MSQNKLYLGIRNEAATNTLELHFLDYIYDGWNWDTWEEIKMVQDTIDKIKAANPSKIKVVINSLGGDVMVGLAIHNYLKSCGIEVETENIGFAASIASIMMMAGGKRKMAANSFMILHAAWSYASGNATDMRKQADNLDKVSGELASIYANTSGKHDAAHFTSMWAEGDVWLTAKECLDLGLITDITGETVSAHASVDLKSYGFKNIPQGLMLASAGPAPEGGGSGILSTIKDEFMKIKNALLAAVGGAKENKDTDKVANKQEVLDLVTSVLTPFAEAVDQAIEELKPKEEENPAPAPAPAPAADPEPAPAPAADPAPVADPEPAPAPAPGEAVTIQSLQAQLEELKTMMANGAGRPAPAASGDNLAAKVKIEYGDAE